jgi:hypothetical protein
MKQICFIFKGLIDKEHKNNASDILGGIFKALHKKFVMTLAFPQASVGIVNKYFFIIRHLGGCLPFSFL